MCVCVCVYVCVHMTDKNREKVTAETHKNTAIKNKEN